MQIFLDFCLLVAPTACVAWLAAVLLHTGENANSSEYLHALPLHRIVWNISLYTFVTTWVTIVIDLDSQLRLSTLHACLTGALSNAWPKRAASSLSRQAYGPDPTPVDLEYHGTILAQSRGRAFLSYWCIRM